MCLLELRRIRVCAGDASLGEMNSSAAFEVLGIDADCFGLTLGRRLWPKHAPSQNSGTLSRCSWRSSTRHRRVSSPKWGIFQERTLLRASSWSCGSVVEQQAGEEVELPTGGSGTTACRSLSVML